MFYQRYLTVLNNLTALCLEKASVHDAIDTVWKYVSLLMILSNNFGCHAVYNNRFAVGLLLSLPHKSSLTSPPLYRQRVQFIYDGLEYMSAKKRLVSNNIWWWDAALCSLTQLVNSQHCVISACFVIWILFGCFFICLIWIMVWMFWIFEVWIRVPQSVQSATAASQFKWK